MYVGVGAARIRDLFATAKAAAPAIVFIDEIDAVGRARSTSAAGGNDEREATLNQLLVEMDGFGAESGVVVMAATNRPDILDAALLRPGRFDRRITLDPPDLKGRAAILAIHAGHKPLAADVDLTAIARQTAGFSGADLANVVNEAALLATRRSAAVIETADFGEAVERVVAGPQRRSRILSPADKRRVAVHEAGHAVVAAAQPGAGQVAKVSLVARGHGQGSTMSMPEGDRVLATRSELSDRIAALLGGRAAEELVLGQPSTGSNDDLARATDLARRMVTECGMSDELGPLAFGCPRRGDRPGMVRGHCGRASTPRPGASCGTAGTRATERPARQPGGARRPGRRAGQRRDARGRGAGRPARRRRRSGGRRPLVRIGLWAPSAPSFFLSSSPVAHHLPPWHA